MWQQDDWYSCEDLTLYQTGFAFIDRSNTNRLSGSCRVSSYPIGCMPEKIARERRGENKGRDDNGVKKKTFSLLVNSIKDKKRICVESVSRLIGSIKQTTQKSKSFDDTDTSIDEFGRGTEDIFKEVVPNPIQDSAVDTMPEDTTDKSSPTPDSSNQRFRQKMHTIHQRVSLHMRLPDYKIRKIPAESLETTDEYSDKLSISGKSSMISLPRTPIEELDAPKSSRCSHEFLLPLSTPIPSLETMFLGCSWTSDSQNHDSS